MLVFVVNQSRPIPNFIRYHKCIRVNVQVPMLHLPTYQVRNWWLIHFRTKTT